MEKSRRGFVSSVAAVGLGTFVFGAARTASAGMKGGSIAADDVLLAMPGDMYYAIPKDALGQFSVAKDAFQQEEARRNADKVVYRGGNRPPPPVALGVRG